MYVTVSLSFGGASWSGGRDQFWKTFEIRQRDGSGGLGTEYTPPEQADEHEQTFKSRFPEVLEKRVNDEIRRAWESRLEGSSSEVVSVV